MLRLFSMAALQAWLVFAAVSYAGALTFGLVDGDDLFTSDDPYLIGMALGMIPAIGAALFEIARGATAKPWFAHTLCAVALVLWCGCCGVVSLLPGEGAAIAGFFAVGSLIAALLGWPLFGRRLPVWAVGTISVAGGVLLLAYCTVTARIGR